MSKRLPVIVATAVWLTISSAAAGPALDRARAALDDLRYEDAATALDEALRAGDNSPSATAEIYRLLGEVNAALGERDRAIDYFDRLLAIDPDAVLREGVSPKLMEPFDAARARAGSREPLGLRCEVGDGSIDVTVTADPLDLAVGAYQSGSGARETAELDSGTAVIVVSDTVLVDEVGLLDEHGNRLAAVAMGQCAQEMNAPPPRDDPGPRTTDDSGSLFGHWALWGGVAVGFAAAGTYFGLETRNKVDELEQLVGDSASHEFSEAQALEDDARRNALFANIGFAAAGVTAIVSGVLLYRSTTREPERDNVVVVPTAGAEGAGVSVRLRF